MRRVRSATSWPAATSGALLDPFSFTPLIMIAGGIGIAGVVIAVLATFGIERQPLSTHYRPASPSA